MTGTYGGSDVHAATLDLAKQLIARRSLAPDDGGCIQLLATRLGEAGFSYERMDRGKPPGRVANLWAWHGTERPLVCLAGHVDVRWSGSVADAPGDSFAATEREGRLYGPGAADAKVSLAAMITAAERFVAAAPEHRGSIAVALTSSERATLPEGMLAIVRQLSWRGEEIDACILGKPTCVQTLGDTIACCSPHGPLVAALTDIISSVTGVTPVIATGRGTSDGALLATVSREVVEFGCPDASNGADEESVSVGDLAPLSIVYEQVIAAFLGSAAIES